MKILLSKNLTAHKERNKLTSIVYALTLGCMIFLMVAVQLQLQLLGGTDTSTKADIVLQEHAYYTDRYWFNFLTAELIDPVLIKH